MPAKKRLNALHRQWELMRLLPKRPPGLSVLELHDRLEGNVTLVCKRTVARDLAVLSNVIALTSEFRQGTEYFWIANDKSIDLPAMSLAEALSWRLIEDFMRPLLPRSVLSVVEPRFGTARDKLTALADDHALGALADKVCAVHPSLAFVPPVTDQTVLDNLQEALLHNRVCEVDYLAADADAPARLPLRILGMVQRGAVTYLVALAFNYSDPRLYPTHRIMTATLTDMVFERPGTFSLQAFVDAGHLDFGHGERLRLSLRVNQRLGKLLIESPLSDDMQLQADGEYSLVEATVNDTWQLQWWLLSMGDDVEVLGPASLRSRIGSRLLSAARMYQVR